MTLQEFSNEFDILYNNIMSNQAPGLNNYEKSVFLTQAQESIIMGLYNGNLTGTSLEGSEEITSYIKSLIKEVSIKKEDNKSVEENEGIIKDNVEKIEEDTDYSIPSKVFYIKPPDDIWFIIYESVILQDDKLKCNNSIGHTALVVPIKHDELYKTNRNPFRKPNSNRVLKVTLNDKIELISNYNIKTYNVRYLSKPKPIILEDLELYGVTINNISTPTECELHKGLHRMILQNAVQLAKSVWKSESYQQQQNN